MRLRTETTSFLALSDLVPKLYPFLAPHEWTATDSTGLAPVSPLYVSS